MIRHLSINTTCLRHFEKIARPHRISARNASACFYGLRHVLLAFTVASVLLAAGDAEAGLKIYYIRHAEGGHNVVEEWADVPKDKWPAYVGNPDAFTPKGEAEQAAVAGKLRNYGPFDFIAASPMWRVRNTILPYLKETGTKGEIWPELSEIYNSHLILSPDLKPPVEKILGAGAPVEIPADEALYFSVRKGGENTFKSPRFPKDHTDMEGEAAAAQLIQNRVIEMIRDRFGGSDKTILLSGHGSSGKGLLRMLTRNRLTEFPAGISNTGVWMVEEQPSGEFELKMYNDVPVEIRKPVSAQ